MLEKPSRNILRRSLGAIDGVREKVGDISWDVEYAVRQKAKDLNHKAKDLSNKAEDFIDKKVEEGKIEESTVSIVTGAGKITYGLARGALAVAGALGHGTAGFFMRRHNPALASRIVQDGFEAASDSIEDGIELIGDGLSELRERRNK